MTPQQKVNAILALPDWKQERLAAHLSVAQSSVHRWVAGAEPRGDKRDAINELYEQLMGSDADTKQVQLAGYVGAGQEVYQFDEGGAGYVEAPPEADETTQAVEVKGGSMLPLYEDGTILYYSKQLAPEGMLGRRCVVRLEDDRVLVKTLRRGTERGLYTLLSLNAPDIEDVAVQWAAPIDWIKPR
jgi:phage repressor protein C with HTH and peptisase S24 domain